MSQSRIVITGTIGSGKSAAADIIRDLGFKVIDADRVNRKLLEKGEKNYLAIKSDPFFKKAFDGEDLDKEKLARMIFSAPDLMARLNSISHPNIIRAIEEEIEKSADRQVFIEIPLFYQMDERFKADKVLFITASEDIQVKRLMDRDKIGELYAKTKIKNQKEAMKKGGIDEYLIKNDGSLEDLRQNIIDFLESEQIYENN